MANVRALSIDVYRDSSIGYYDYSNHGVSSRFNELYLACEDGNLIVDEKDPQLVKIVKRHLFGKDYLHIEPYQSEGHWFMAGGNLAFSCDSRCRELSEYPLQIHDREEK